MKTSLFFTLALLGFLTTCFGQQDSNWVKWNGLIGEWTGEGSGRPGQGAGYFSFRTDLDKHILVRKSHTEFATADPMTTIVHDDLMIIYADNTSSPSKAIYFDNEGHTINYMVSYAENAIMLTSEKAEGNPVFRLTYTLLDKETVNTKFEMSQDGVTFFTYVEGKSKKTKQSGL